MAEGLNNDQSEVRKTGAVIKSSLAYYKALLEMGLQPSFNSLDEFDFSKTNYEGQTLILSSQIAIPESFYENLRRFVQRGGNLIVDGQTAFYNENTVCKMVNDFPLKDLFGGSVSEFKYCQNSIDNHSTVIGGLLLYNQIGFIKKNTGTPFLQKKKMYSVLKILMARAVLFGYHH